MPRKIKGLLLFGLILVMVSCDSKAVFDIYQSFPNTWHKDSLANFTFKAPDTVNTYNLYINVRNNDAYRYNNLFLIAELSFPNGKIIKDTLEYKMAKPSGELLGTGFSDIKENKLWYKGYKDPFVFSESGDYRISIQQAMRQNGQEYGIIELEGITEVGFRVESIE